jgi:hypothetical protein
MKKFLKKIIFRKTAEVGLGTQRPNTPVTEMAAAGY